MQNYFEEYDAIWDVKFAFSQPPGEVPAPFYLVAEDVHTGQRIHLTGNDLQKSMPPFTTEERSLFIGYDAAVEWGCFLSLGWPLPKQVLDLYVEFRNLTYNLPIVEDYSLTNVLAYYGIDSPLASGAQTIPERMTWREPFTENEKHSLKQYCDDHVDCQVKLFDEMAANIDLPRALYRGRYMTTVACIERNGIPVDVELLDRLNANWDAIKGRLIHALDEHGIWEGTTFKVDRFTRFLMENKIPWPCCANGQLKLDKETFREMARMYPELCKVQQLRYSLSDLRLTALSVGHDGYNRTGLRPFRSKTGRNQPSNTRFIFGPAVWIRSLIKPQPDHFVAYLDYSQQEFAIAAVLSGDKVMQEAYQSGDPYLAFAKQAGAVPEDATKQTHPEERERFKICALGVQYGMGEHSLAIRLNEPVFMARQLLKMHQETYAQYWEFINKKVEAALLGHPLRTVFGWSLKAGDEPNPRSLANFPAQANGAEMLRIACTLAIEHGIRVCAPVHDALLVEGHIDEINTVIERTKNYMIEAGHIVLNGFAMNVDVATITYPNQYADKRGLEMWATSIKLLTEIKEYETS